MRWFTDKLENDSFIYGNPDLDMGDVLIRRPYRVASGFLLAQTDRHLIIFDTGNFPMIACEAFDLKSKRDLVNYILDKASAQKTGFE